MTRPKNRYTQLIEHIFRKHYRAGAHEVIFERTEVEPTAKRLGIKLVDNIGDIIYSYRYRTPLPEAITRTAPRGYQWIIRPAGRARYKFALSKIAAFLPNTNLAAVKVPDATPGIITKYAFNDEQSILAKIRYNRLIDIFTGVTCYSLQSHLRTTLPEVGQVETDEVYLGIDKHGVQYVFPIQAKGGKDRLGIVQIEQDFAICEKKFPLAIGRPLAAQFLDSETIVLFEFGMTDEGVRISAERHFKLVNPDDITDEELRAYRTRSSDQ